MKERSLSKPIGRDTELQKHLEYEVRCYNISMYDFINSFKNLVKQLKIKLN
jgi:hypothetical protein